MGAQYFTATANGKTAREAFINATSDACYENGHGGYTGTIAEKADFVIETPDAGVSPEDYIRQCLDWETVEHWALQDKWGPACAVKTGEDEWTFFGSASA